MLSREICKYKNVVTVEDQSSVKSKLYPTFD